MPVHLCAARHERVKRAHGLDTVSCHLADCSPEAKVIAKGSEMIVKTRPDARPICDVHHARMEYGRYEAANIGMKLHAYACTVPGCWRAYQHGLGYCDIETAVSLENKVCKGCRKCGTTMYLVSDDESNQIWECGQDGCNHRETVLLQSAAS